MTTEQIATIRNVRISRAEFENRQREALKFWDKENLIPLVEICDHQYPWNESAFKEDRDLDASTCLICFSRKYRR